MSCDHLQEQTGGEAVNSVWERRKLSPGGCIVLESPVLLDTGDVEAKKGWSHWSTQIFRLSLGSCWSLEAEEGKLYLELLILCSFVILRGRDL